MAIEKQKTPKGSAEAAPPAMTQKRRWLVIGSNVVVAILLATALAAAAVWLSGALLRGKARSDWTTTGRFSLSPRTKALLKELPCEIRLTCLYAHGPESPASEEQYQRVQDLLAEYEAAAPSRVTVEAVNRGVDVAGTEALLGRLKQRYEKELEKPKALVDTFDKLQKELSDFLNAEAKKLDVAAGAWKNGPADGVGTLRMIARAYRERAMLGDITAGIVQKLAGDILPAYSSALSAAKDDLRKANELLTAVPKSYTQIDENTAEPLPPEVKAILTTGKATNEPWRKRIDEFMKKSQDLPQLELDSIRREIAEGEVILIETHDPSGKTPDRVKVVTFEDVWIRNPAANERTPDEQVRLFAGETAISSALLNLCQPEKPAVLFVTFGAPATMAAGPPMMGGGRGGPFAELAERLRKNNFIVEDWDLMREPQMPRPEHMTKAILVFVPPAPPSMQRPMPPATPDTYKTAIDAVKAGTPCILVAEPAAAFGPGIPYAELFGLFGVTAKTNAIAVHKQVVDAAGTEKAVGQIDITSYDEHVITKPLSGLPTVFVQTCPVLVSKTLPAGVTAVPIVQLPGGRDYWADTNLFEAMNGEAKFDEAEDIAGPAPIGVAAARKVDSTEQKCVMFGGHFAEDRIAFYRDPFTGQERFPGNAELFVNSVLWVSGTEHLITVSPEALQARRIGDVGGWLLPLQILIIAGLPALVLVAGIIVYVIRRR